MRRFLEALWPSDLAGCFTIWTNPGHVSYHVPLADLRAASDDDLKDIEKVNETHCVYYGLGLRREGLPSHKRGTKRDVVALPGFVIDIDTLDPAAHEATNLPETEDQVFDILAPFPEPSMVVSTGHGYHVYWLFKEPVRLNQRLRMKMGDAYRRFQEPFIHHAQSLGFHLDQTDTIDRVWRIPGYYNRKADPPVRVELAAIGEARYDVGKLVGDQIWSESPETDSDRKTKPDSERVTERESITLVSVKKILARLSDPEQAEMFDAILEGKSFAERGKRDAALQKACSVIVYCAKGKGEPEKLVKILAPSLKVWADEEGADKSYEEEIEKAIDKIERAQEDWDRNEAEEEARRQRTLDALGRKFFGSDYEDGQLEPKHLIIQYRRSYFVFNFKIEHYGGPFIKEELLPIVRDFFEGSAFPTTYINASGDLKQMTHATLMDQYGTVAMSLEGSLVLQHSRLNRDTLRFTHAVAPIRDELTPRYDPEIQQWLMTMGGRKPVGNGTSDTYGDLVVRWVTGVSQLERQCAALMLVGDPGTGKTTLAHGLSRLWHKAGPTTWRYAVGTEFNELLARCPLIELSEGLDDSRGASSSFRDLIGTDAIVVNPKGLPPYPLEGSVRIIMSANDDTVLSDITGHREMSNESIQAIAERLLYVSVESAAATFLDHLKQRDPTIVDRWIRDDLIARHALWLRDNVSLPPSRFVVSGHLQSVHQRLAARRPNTEAVLEWLVGFMSQPWIFYKSCRTKRKTPSMLIGDGRLVARSQDIKNEWKIYTDDTLLKPTVTAIGRCLKNLCLTKKKMRSGEYRYHGYSIDPGVVVAFAEDNMIGDLDAMKKHLDRPVNENINHLSLVP